MNTGIVREKSRIPLILPFAWLYLSVSRGVFFWQERTLPMQFEDVIEGSSLVRSILIVLILGALAVLYARRSRTLPILRDNMVVLALFFFMAVSIFWSGYSFVSVKRYIKAFGSLVMVMIILTDVDPKKAVTLSLGSFLTCTTGISFLLIVLVPGIGRIPDFTGRTTWVGLTFTKNNLGQLTVLGSVFFLWSVLHSRSIVKKTAFFCFLLVNVFLLLGSRSITAGSTFAVTAVMMLFMLFARRMIMTAWGVLVILPVILGIILFLIGDLILREPLILHLISLTGSDITFTGRTDLWRDVFRLALERPILGYGYSGFWVGMFGSFLWSKFEWRPNQAHNGYLDVFVQLGMIGFILMVIIIVRAVYLSIRKIHTDYDFGVLTLVVLLIVLINNFFESSFIRLNHLYWAIFLLFGLKHPLVTRSGESSDARTRHRACSP